MFSFQLRTKFCWSLLQLMRCDANGELKWIIAAESAESVYCLFVYHQLFSFLSSILFLFECIFTQFIFYFSLFVLLCPLSFIFNISCVFTIVLPFHTRLSSYATYTLSLSSTLSYILFNKKKIKITELKDNRLKGVVMCLDWKLNDKWHDVITKIFIFDDGEDFGINLIISRFLARADKSTYELGDAT